MELLATLNHPVLNRLRSLNTVAGVRRSRAATDDTDAHIGISPQGRALRTDGRVPLVEVGETNLIVVLNRYASCRALY